jgi:diguanylate cyclase (GGDEF)-like protein/PAS domain S-box-containing protein
MRTKQPNFELILSTITDGVVVVDEHGMVLFANQSAEQIFERGPLLGTKLAIPSTPDILASEINIIRRSGIGWAELRSSPILWEGQSAFLIAIRDITERKQSELVVQLGEDALRESEQKLRLAQEIANIGSWDFDLATSEMRWSEGLYRIYGVSPATCTPTSESLISLIHPDDQSAMQAWIASCAAGKRPGALRFRCIWPDGSLHFIEGRGTLMQDAKGGAVSMAGTAQDITERIQIELAIRIAATAFESQEGMIVTDANGTILRVNAAFTATTGYTPEEVIGKNPSILQSGRQSPEFYAEMWGFINKTGGWEGEVWNRRKSGDLYPEHLTITAVNNSEGVVTNYVGTLTDVTMSKAASEEIHRLAFSDTLTGLPNRRLLQDRLTQAFASSARSGNEGALLFIDLDNFKTLNDTLGHDMGDLLLKQIADRLSSCVREGDTVARFGGDEFLVMLEDMGKHDIEAATLAEIIGNKILTVLSQPYQLSTQIYNSTCSIGATLFSNHKASVDELLKQADIALYQAKASGRNALRFFDPDMQVSISNRVALENDLRTAIAEHQFHLHYQVQVDSSGHTLGAEALIRWMHPVRGLLSPLEFIPLAEETGLILPIGQWVLETACAQLASWQIDPATSSLTLAVNVSARQFRQDDFVAYVSNALQQHHFNPNLLKLELTESLLLAKIEDTIAKMQELKKLGIQFSLDDFGTGYSSLQYLKRLPLDQLKIDQSFVRDIFRDTSDQAIVRTIIAMAQTLNLAVIAEGVETEEQRLLLMGQGCTHYQGYLFGKPVPHDQFQAMLKKK